MERSAIGDESGRSREIVVGVDGSDAGQRALRWAVEEALVRGCAVRVVTAWVPEPLTEFAFASTRDVPGELEEDLRREVDELLAELPEPPVVRISVAQGPPAAVLLDAATDADLLVVGAHRGGLLREITLGSVSTTCVRHARCPVVVLPPPRRSRQHGEPSVPPTA
ncbi:Nucleotide-binding universal stress protein, UspA family [Streptoalloteichus tenebrarius]|uniref:Nucleotide-binding universal stress protein, UspA family n=1 Tax=Streptoalloteichus tenebrarius (strain ATCC 17920 / DSM 40477 / JCM 4838 / CBS 697.72 / NBRC 16177 / NCIMB 11028 / NRRL B-12390 / A12253. 1 / ISP 5477) TaxID=1933 RepID=A0ABT1HQK7_STRSD|nr:universal stress protein [Streptoalloteichus tenebrarius]MCP2257793.1 Nucleotide-binding universal stress protein, UspA family [Streptoalloteichus tenebrarius]BFE99846.1 universal stress protein [Streptoalloteichus tenebrarius]